MKINFFKITTSLLLISVLIFSCKDDDSGPSLMCENGFEPIDGSCQCPEGMVQAYGTCRTLVEDEWYGISTDCQCEDTLFLRITNIDIEEGEARLKFNGNIVHKPGDPLASYPSSSGQVKYFELMNGDSIAPRGLPYGMLTCDANEDVSIDYLGALYGKISPSRDKIDMMIEWRVRQTPTVVVDTCYVTFRR